MSEPRIDHRRAVALRNTSAILDATERLLARGATLSMAGVASQAGVSRQTLYVHFASLAELVEAAVERAVGTSMSAVEAAAPQSGPAEDALGRMLTASWQQLARQDALVRAAAQHVPGDRLQRAHAPLMAAMRDLVARGQADGTFRSDMPKEWLVTMFYALIHAADDHARTQRTARADVLEMLRTAIGDLFSPREPDRP